MKMVREVLVVGAEVAVVAVFENQFLSAEVERVL
jgi:hypothetical protein